MANTPHPPAGMARFDVKLPAYLCDRLEAMADARQTDLGVMTSLLLARIAAESDLFA